MITYDLLPQFTWTSGYVVDGEINGFNYVQSLYESHGYSSLIGFGRSEDLLTSQSTLSKSANLRIPHGYVLFIYKCD